MISVIIGPVGPALSLEVGFCPTRKKPSRMRLDLQFRGSVIINTNSDGHPIFLLGFGIGLNPLLG